jgi:hypothetical protein
MGIRLACRFRSRYLSRMETRVPFEITPQPDDSTCGPSCLHAVYRYYDDDMPLDQLIREVPSLEGGGTLAVQMACHALRRGYKATIYTYNLHLFDPTWFREGAVVDIAGKLREQARHKVADAKLQFATPAYIEFMERGGRLRFVDLTPALIRSYLTRGMPLITGLSSTYLYRSSREIGDERLVDDDVRGYPSGHFVVLCGYDRGLRKALVADPFVRNPVSGDQQYTVDISRVLIAILLGVITYDANLLIIRPSH